MAEISGRECSRRSAGDDDAADGWENNHSAPTAFADQSARSVLCVAVAKHNHYHDKYDNDPATDHNHLDYIHDLYHHNQYDHDDDKFHHHNTPAYDNNPSSHNYYNTAANDDDIHHHYATPMKVSCVCPTFARVHLLEEAVESFLRQDYKGEKELVICNDCDRQTLKFDHSEVRIFNLKSRFETIGQKRNFTSRLADGQILMTWGDDDIHLPNRISRMISAMQGEMLMEGHHYCWNDTLFRHHHSTCGAHAVRSCFFWKLGGVPEINLGEDIGFNKLAEEAMGKVPVCTDDPAFIYRWSSGRPHLSWGVEHYGRMGDGVDSLIHRGMEPEGEYHLKPHWKQDYVALTQTAILK